MSAHRADLHSRLRTALAHRHHVERELGAGETARVFRAGDLEHRRQVAIKVLDPELAAAIDRLFGGDVRRPPAQRRASARSRFRSWI